MFKKVFLVCLLGVLVGCASLKSQFSKRPESWERDVFIKRYEDVNGVPIGIAAPDQDAYSVTFMANQNHEWNERATLIMEVREELKNYATSFTASVIVHELFHAINLQETSTLHNMPMGCYSYGQATVVDKFKETPLPVMCQNELTWLDSQKLGENRQIKLRKADAWMEPSIKMAIAFFNSQVDKTVFWYGGLQ